SAEVHHAQVGNDAVDAHVVLLGARRPARLVVADRADHIALAVDEYAQAVVGYEERVCVVDAVAGEAAQAEQLALRFRVIADAGDIRLSPSIDLHRADEGMAAPAPEVVK